MDATQTRIAPLGTDVRPTARRAAFESPCCWGRAASHPTSCSRRRSRRAAANWSPSPFAGSTRRAEGGARLAGGGARACGGGGAAEHGRLPHRAHAVLTAKLAREAFATDWVKLEVIGDEGHPAAGRAGAHSRRRSSLWTRGLSSFRIRRTIRFWRAVWRHRVCCGDAARLADRQRDGDSQPVQHRPRSSVRRSSFPVVLDAGIGTASDAAPAMELGCDAVLAASAISRAADPARMGAGDARGVCRPGDLREHAGRIPGATTRPFDADGGHADLTRS